MEDDWGQLGHDEPDDLVDPDLVPVPIAVADPVPDRDPDPGADGIAAPDADPGLQLDIDALGAVEAELADVELALRRLDDGTYGRCEVCDAAIDDAHLAEAPAARFCRAHLPITLG